MAPLAFSPTPFAPALTLYTPQQAGEQRGPIPIPRAPRGSVRGLMRRVAEGNRQVAFRQGMRSHLERMQREI